MFLDINLYSVWYEASFDVTVQFVGKQYGYYTNTRWKFIFQQLVNLNNNDYDVQLIFRQWKWFK